MNEQGTAQPGKVETSNRLTTTSGPSANIAAREIALKTAAPGVVIGGEEISIEQQARTGS